MNLLHSCNLTLQEQLQNPGTCAHAPTWTTNMKTFLSYRLKCMVLTSWFPYLILCNGSGFGSGTETMQLLLSQHNIACTRTSIYMVCIYMVCIYMVCIFLGFYNINNSLQEQILKDFLRLAHIISARRTDSNKLLKLL